MAKLYFFYGAMNSGKTTRILQCAFNYEEQDMHPIIMKPKVDTKGNNYIEVNINDGSSNSVMQFAMGSMDD